MAIEIKVFKSGSDGNCYFIKSGSSKLLIEAGIPFKAIQKAMWDIGESISSLDGCLISHCHQ